MPTEEEVVAGGVSEQSIAEAEAVTTAVAATIDHATAVSQGGIRQKYLFPFVSLGEVQNYLRTQVVRPDSALIERITALWPALQAAIQRMQLDEAALASSIELSDMPAEFDGAKQAIEANPAFKKTFQQTQYQFAMVEIDKMICCQRHINLDYVATLCEGFGPTLDSAQLVDICIAPDRERAPIRHLELRTDQPAIHSFTSENVDLRFLGSYINDLEPGDMERAERGGIPVIAVISFIGFGASPINAFLDAPRRRVVLNNGYHRVYALRSLGVTHIPLVLMIANNPAMHLPPVFPGGLPKDYVINTARPSLFRDFFRDDWTIELRVKKRLKGVTVQIASGDHEIPV